MLLVGPIHKDRSLHEATVRRRSASNWPAFYTASTTLKDGNHPMNPLDGVSKRQALFWPIDTRDDRVIFIVIVV